LRGPVACSSRGPSIAVVGGDHGDLGEPALLARARSGSEDAYRELVEVHRAELHAHCYRILGSVQDADDAVQDALLRAWRGLAGFEGRSSLRSWLYKIATNAALDVAQRRSRRELPMTHGPCAGSGEGPGVALLESVWVEPYPDQAFGVAAGLASPEAQYERRESLELAFVAALQYLPALQRAVLILREVLGFSNKETADLLGATVPAVQSALQRGRAAARDRIPGRSQQAALRTLGDKRLRELVGRYCDAIERGDAEAVVAMLTEDAVWAMPPVVTWYRGRPAIARFLRDYGFNEAWRHITTRASGQLAMGCYTFEPRLRCWVPSVLRVLKLDGDRIAEVTDFVTAELLSRWGQEDDRFVGATAFPRFGLPAVLPG
jgi:RNA polymerase sigma-70 factor (ECF subfamily)